MKKVVLLAIAGLTLASVAAYAQMQHQGHGNHAQMHQNHECKMGPGMMHGGMQHGNTASGGTSHGAMTTPQGILPKGDTGPSSLAFNSGTTLSPSTAAIAFTGNADVDFVKGMIPHHQGAIDMAKTVLGFGKDPEVRKLAEEVIKAQEGEIALMKEWLKKTGQ